ncbi:M23 family metallopeptidase [Candidatus Latescibacterota bacterium]
MTWKRLTFILIPHSKSGIKQFSVSRLGFVAAGIILVTTVGIMIFYILGFKGKSFYTSKTKEISERNLVLEKNLDRYNSTLMTMSATIDSIEMINEKIPTKFAISERDLKLKEKQSVVVSNTGLELPLERVFYLINRMDKKSIAFEHNYESLFDYCEKINDFLRHLPSIRPAEGFITKEFEHSFDIVANERKLHTGVDINNVEGTPVIATADGIIEKDGFSNQIGRYIIIDHQNGYKTQYAHLQRFAQMEKKIKVNTGEKVSRGQQIGCIGRTGRSVLAVPALIMYSVMHHDTLVNPANYFFISEDVDYPAVKTPVVQNL